MSRAPTLVIATATLLLAACSRLGLGEPECEPAVQNPSSAMILSLQAVPTAKYAPCINSMQLGWETLDFEAASGQARFSLTLANAMRPFFTATLTETCDLGSATPVPHPLLDKYESVHSVESEIRVTIIPSALRPRLHAEALAEDLAGVRVDGRPVLFTVAPDIGFAMRTQVNRALTTSQFVWIISELDVSEDTLELRHTPEGEGDRGLSVNEAIRRMEELVPEVVYEGNWYYLFDGGCITYEFDAQGTVAETVKQDVLTSVGFYPLDELREIGREIGIDVGVDANG